MSVPSLSFGFGDSKTPVLNDNVQNRHYTHINTSYNRQLQPRCKRRINDIEDELPSKIRGSSHKVNKLKPKRSIAQFKKHKSQEVTGEPLPLKRIVETLDHESLQNLMINLIDRRPDITLDVLELSPKITIEQTFKILDKKMNNIIESLPYKVDPTSDYSYLRVQKQVVDFFNSFSDYILNFLSPVEEDITITLKFLNEFLMNIFHKMPVFKNLEFKFFYDLSVEKLNLIFVNYLTKFLKSNKSNILVIIKDDWVSILHQLNELNHFKFQKVYDFAKEEIDSFNEKGYYHNSDLEDEDEDQEKNHKLRGLNSLVNFSEGNSPLIGGGSAISDSYLL